MRNARPEHEGERGATLVIVALVFVALLGMVVLTVDVGGLLAKRRSLVNAADAAALAAAQSCGRKEGETAATAQALQYAVANGGAGTTIVDGFPTYSPGCLSPNGSVTVRVRADQATFFAPALGYGKSSAVVAEATATWGGVGSGPFVPFMLSEGSLLQCGIGTEELLQEGTPTSPVYCTFWMDNKISEMGNAEWAMLNLNASGTRWGWNVPPDYSSCVSANTNETINWIDNGAAGLTLNYPNPTYVCVDTGASPPTFKELYKYVGYERLFPVNDPGIPGANQGYTDERLVGTGMKSNRPHGQVNKAGQLCPSPCTAGNGLPGYNGPVDKYDIVGFAKLKIISVQQGSGTDQSMGGQVPGGGQVTCAVLDQAGTWVPRAENSNAWCLKVQWLGYYTDVNNFGGDNFGPVVVRLTG